jgi:ATP-dependent exoDNAse (exonuclease V) beta subunit
MLSEINSHPRDQYIKFYPNGHRYEISTDQKSKYISVTTWAHSHFPKFNADEIIKKMMSGKNWNPQNKYWGMSPEQIKSTWKQSGQNSCTNGTNLHERIENFMNCPELGCIYTNQQLLDFKVGSETESETQENPEWEYFINFMRSVPDLKPYRTEWMIFDEDLKISGSIDMVFENPDGTLSIYDWKRCKDITRNNDWNKYATNPIISHIPDTNFWHYSLQLNIYKAILERKYGKEIKELYLVKLHPDDLNNNFELIELPILTDDINNLFNERLSKLI